MLPLIECAGRATKLERGSGWTADAPGGPRQTRSPMANCLETWGTASSASGAITTSWPLAGLARPGGRAMGEGAHGVGIKKSACFDFFYFLFPNTSPKWVLLSNGVGSLQVCRTPLADPPASAGRAGGGADPDHLLPLLCGVRRAAQHHPDIPPMRSCQGAPAARQRGAVLPSRKETTHKHKNPFPWSTPKKKQYHNNVKESDCILPVKSTKMNNF